MTTGHYTILVMLYIGGLLALYVGTKNMEALPARLLALFGLALVVWACVGTVVLIEMEA